MMKLQIFVGIALAQNVWAASLVRGSTGFPGRPVKTYAECQRNTSNPLQGCPEGTLFVSRSSALADFNSIQDAIVSLLNDESAHVILVASGTYTEQVNVTRPGPVTLLGQSDDPYLGLSYGNAQSDTTHHNEVQIVWAAANNDSSGRIFDNAFTSVLTVAPTWNASLTGTGPTGFPVPPDTPFGNSDFRAYNIDFRNVFAPQAAGPSLAVGVAYANAGFYGCGFYSYQDTVYVGKLGNAYFYDNVIAGQVDFLYGFGTAWVEKSTLALRNCHGAITAWKGTNTTFTNKYGVYVSDSRVIAANNSIAASMERKCPLGRPWNSLHRSIFLNSYMDKSILPEGYIQWGITDPRFDGNTFMAVHENFGPGYDATALNKSTTLVLDDQTIRPYRSPVDVFTGPNGESGDVSWIDEESLLG
ncbi:pectin lyase fold/virulence factor [Stachybotrys elegans]|uniref:pectinesterase n=1 Tax=Stachybotrys elegans TaxID=80388 RepID=A0A8K0WNA3_9HYPO|nr:pectin lyase fold/virulence factor [Stachybotrys elegans]